MLNSVQHFGFKLGVGTTTRQHREEECWIRHGKPGDVMRCQANFSAFKNMTLTWLENGSVVGKFYISVIRMRIMHMFHWLANLNGQLSFCDLPWLHGDQNSVRKLPCRNFQNDVGPPCTILRSRILRDYFFDAKLSGLKLLLKFLNQMIQHIEFYWRVIWSESVQLFECNSRCFRIWINQKHLQMGCFGTKAKIFWLRSSNLVATCQVSHVWQGYY